MNNKIIVVKGVLAVVLILMVVKLFFCIIRYSGDPTISLALKVNPFSENIIINADSSNLHQHIILYSDENEFLGENFIKFIFGINNFILIFLLLFGFYYKKNIDGRVIGKRTK